MRENLNNLHIEGYVYDISKLEEKVTKEGSKHPGTPFLTGVLSVATDEDGLNVIPVHFTYVTEFYSKSGKVNHTFSALKKLMTEGHSWVTDGKENAPKVKIDGNTALTDFIKDKQRISAKRCEGSFVNIVTKLCDENERNTFQTDMVIQSVVFKEADPEKHIAEDYVAVNGYVFNFRNDLLPVDFSVHSPNGMKYFQNLDISNSEPCYTKVWGKLVNQTIVEVRTEESAFDESAVSTAERTTREWTITGTAKVPYDFGDENIMTIEDLNKGIQNREILWAEIEKRNAEYEASKKNGNTPAPVTAAPKAPVQTGGFSF